MSSDPDYSLPKIDVPGHGDMEAQLVSLYEEKRRLFRALGTADPDAIIAMVRSLEAQLLDLYADRDRT
ncbi:MAG: hypothetical protein AAFP04_12810 [Myxococcota bacterium]